MTPLVSILTPSLDQGRWLPRNLESVAAQTYPEIEHIVMDGGSSDETVAVLRDAPNVHWTSELDRGQSHALNKALAASSGDIVGWLNADDAYFSHDAVECAVSALEQNADVAAIYGHAALVDGSDRLLHYLWAPPFSTWLLQRFNYISQPTVFLRRAAIAEVFVDESYDSWMDRELWLRLARVHRFQRVNRVLAIDRHHSDRKSYVRHLADADSKRLAATYGLPSQFGNRVEEQLWKVGARVAGVRLLFADDARPELFVHTDTRMKVLVRQLATRRASMSSD